MNFYKFPTTINQPLGPSIFRKERSEFRDHPPGGRRNGEEIDITIFPPVPAVCRAGVAPISPNSNWPMSFAPEWTLDLPNGNFALRKVRGVDFRIRLGVAWSKDDPAAARDDIISRARWSGRGGEGAVYDAGASGGNLELHATICARQEASDLLAILESIEGARLTSVIAGE